MNEVPPNTLLGQAEFLRAGAYTRRYHGWRTIKDDPVGLHTYNVVNLITLLFPGCSRELLLTAIRHDSAEWVVGDLPSTAKKRVPALKLSMDVYEEEVWASVGLPMPVLLASDKRKLKIADYLEGMMFCIQERQMGNLLIVPVFHTFHSYMGALLWPSEGTVYANGCEGPAHHLFEDLCDKWIDLGERFR